HGAPANQPPDAIIQHQEGRSPRQGVTERRRSPATSSILRPMLILAQEAAANFPLLSWHNAIALLTLTALETVLGIDNIVFIAILSGKPPEHQRARARLTGLSLALVTRILLLLTIYWIVGLAKSKAFHIPLVDHDASWRDVVLLAGG